MRVERKIEPLFVLLVILLALMGCASPAATIEMAPSATTSLLEATDGALSIKPPLASSTAPVTVSTELPTVNPKATEAIATPSPSEPTAASTTKNPVAPTPAPTSATGVPDVIGWSFGRRPIEAYRFGQGDAVIVLVGGIHGGYEANSVELARRFVEYFLAEPAALPSSVVLHIIPDANPDGSALTAAALAANPAAETLSGRFNGRGVDLNRNWDCLWSPEAFLRNQPISAGSAPFSEPETQALRDYLIAADPTLVIFFHSAAGAIYGPGCPEPDPAGLAWADIYGQASGYPVYPIFDHYAITGDASDWLSTKGIASFTIELTNHEDIEWERNLAGASAVITAAVPQKWIEPPQYSSE